MKEILVTKLEDALERELDDLENLETGSEEYDKGIRRISTLAEHIETIDKDAYEYFDKEERRNLEAEKLKKTAELEEKNRLTSWFRGVLDVGKAVVPVVITVIAYDTFQKRILKFEETGRITSTAGRELHLPKFMK